MLNLSVEITWAEQQLLFAGAIVVCYGERIAVMRLLLGCQTQWAGLAFLCADGAAPVAAAGHAGGQTTCGGPGGGGGHSSPGHHGGSREGCR